MPFLTFLLPLLQRREDDSQELNDNGSVNIRGDTHRKDGKLAQGTAGEQVHESEEIALIKELLDYGRIYSRYGDVSPQTEYCKHNECKNDPLAELRYLVDVRKGFKHLRSPRLRRLLP